MTESIHAIVVDDHQRMRWAPIDRPALGAGQVRVRAAATAVNRADLLQRRGRYPVPPGASTILGLEVAGHVAELGEGVDGWSVGDPVCALLEGGGYAEEVIVDAGMLLPIPAGLSPVQAAALPEVFYTAYLNVFIEPTIAPGEAVLIHAAASGVGTAAVQLCRAFGHPCLGTASAGKLADVEALGASAVFDRKSGSFVDAARALTGGRGVDVILDPVGASYLGDNVDALARGGRLVIIGLLGGPKAELPIHKLLMKRLRIVGSVLRSRTREEKLAITTPLRDRVWPLFDDGTLKPVVDAVIPIDEAERAHALLEENATTGKVVLTMPSAG